MGEQEKTPSYMTQLLDELGWNQGTRIPLSNQDNQNLETLLINRQNEVQRLKEAVILQNQKCKDLDKYKEYVHSEYQENTRLLFAHKQQLEQEVKLRQLSQNEAEALERGVGDCQKQSKDITARIDRLQNNIGRFLKKADGMKSEVCGERGALQEWRAALERSAGDISAIEQFTKQDLSKARALETKRQQLKQQHDRLQERLNQLVADLSAEERACDRISVQVMEGMEQRKQMMTLWTSAVDNLRQRDKDIRHIREDYAVLDTEANNVAEKCREQQAFCEQQSGNNLEAQRENMVLTQQLSQTRFSYQNIVEENATLDSEVQISQRELSTMRVMLEKLHMVNKQIMDEQYRRDVSIQTYNDKIRELKEKLAESTDKSKSSEKRAKELEDILNEEERYTNQLTVNQQRAMHCSFVEQQKLLALKNEEKLFLMKFKASKAVMNKLQTKYKLLEKNLQIQKESLYALCYQVETIGARVSHMEGAQSERECSAELLEKENRLKDVCARHAARVALLERHSGKLLDDMRRLARDLEAKNAEHSKLTSRLKMWTLNVEGGRKDVEASKETWRRARVEEALMRLRVVHAERALESLDGEAFSLDRQRLTLQAAMAERLTEISARRDLFEVQQRALEEDCGKLRSEIREREQRIEQLKKRYEIFIASLGKDDSGQQLSVTFFKIKFAAERAELRARGAALDADIGRRERDISALEATLRVVHAAHHHFMHRIAPLNDDTVEIQELNCLSKQYYESSDELKAIKTDIATVREQRVSDLGAELRTLAEKNNQLAARENEMEIEFENACERVARQENHLQNAREVLKANAKRAKKLIDGDDEWRIFQLSVWVRDYGEAAENALSTLITACSAPDARSRLGALLAATYLTRLLAKDQRRLQLLIERMIIDGSVPQDCVYVEETVFSSSRESTKSGVSIASGYTKRLSAFRRTLGTKVAEKSLIDDIPEQARQSTISCRVLTLGLEESMPDLAPPPTSGKRRSFK